MKKKKIVIFGPIQDFGGREVEVNIIAKALENNFDVAILSSSNITENSFALKDLKDVSWNCLSKTLYSNNILLKLLASFSKLLSKGKNPGYFYCNNSFAKKVFNFKVLQRQVIEKEIKTADLVLCCAQLTTQFLPEIVQFCKKNSIPCLVRTTGTIREFDSNQFAFLKDVTTFIHHSERNAKKLNDQINLPYVVIDQCANYEEGLLNLPITVGKSLRFGYLGRLSEEKGILPLAQFFSKNNYSFKIAGDGPQKENILKVIENNTNCEYLGQFKNEQIVNFFSQIDVLVIPSLEESGPLVGLEAMAAGKIIISTDVGAMKERFEGLNGYWFDIKKMQSLEVSLNEIEGLSKDNLEKQMCNNRQRYLIDYKVSKISEKYKNLIDCFINE